MVPRWPTGVLLISLGLGAGLRWRALRSAWSRPPGDADEAQYVQLGQRLAARDGSYSLGGSPGEEAFRAPLYPVLIALAAGPRPEGLGRVRAAQCLLGLGEAVLVFGLAAFLSSPAAGAIASLVFAVNPPQIASETSFYINALYGFLVLLAAACLARFAERPSGRGAACAGLAVGLSAACRSPLLPLGLAAAALTAVRPEFGARRTRTRLAGILLASTLAPLAPWTLRNAVALHEFVPLERGAADVNIFTGSLGIIETVKNRDVPAMAARLGLPPGPGEAYRRALLALALRQYAAHPLRSVVSTARRLALLIRQTGREVGAPLLLLALAGPWACRRRRAGAALAGVVAYFWLVHSPFSVNDRYTVPLVPLVCVLAGCSTARLGARLSRRLEGGPAGEETLVRPLAAAGGVGAVLMTACALLLACDLFEAGRRRSSPPVEAPSRLAERPVSLGSSR